MENPALPSELVAKVNSDKPANHYSLAELILMKDHGGFGIVDGKVVRL